MGNWARDWARAKKRSQRSQISQRGCLVVKVEESDPSKPIALFRKLRVVGHLICIGGMLQAATSVESR